MRYGSAMVEKVIDGRKHVIRVRVAVERPRERIRGHHSKQGNAKGTFLINSMTDGMRNVPFAFHCGAGPGRGC